MKILLTTLNSKFIHTNLAIRYLKSYVKDLIDVDIREVSYDSENAMQKYPFVDYILCGEGELVFRDLVMYLQGNKNIENVEGIVYRNNGEIIVNRPKELLQNLDEIPSPF